MDHDILPMTERGVAVGNKVFGAALLRKTELSVVIAGTNAETDNPLFARRSQHTQPVLRDARSDFDARPTVPVDTSTTSSATRIRGTPSRSLTT
jgi:hypothetical protein